MSGLQSCGDLPHDAQSLVHRQPVRMLLEFFPQAAPLNELHHDRRAILRALEIMHRDDVRVPQPRHHAGLAFETFEEDRIIRQLARQHLHRHLAVQTDLPAEIHRAHAATTERCHDLDAVHFDHDFLRHQPLRHKRVRFQPGESAMRFGGISHGVAAAFEASPNLIRLPIESTCHARPASGSPSPRPRCRRPAASPPPLSVAPHENGLASDARPL